MQWSDNGGMHSVLYMWRRGRRGGRTTRFVDLVNNGQRELVVFTLHMSIVCGVFKVRFNAVSL